MLEHDAPAGSLIFALRDAGKVAEAEAAGYPVVAVPQPYLYLDYAETDDPEEPLAIGAPLPGSEQAKLDTQLQAARATLSSAEQEALLAEGRGLSLAQAVAEALSLSAA